MTEGTLHAVDCEPIEFANDFFVKGNHDLIHNIKRKDAKPRPAASNVSPTHTFYLNKQAN